MSNDGKKYVFYVPMRLNKPDSDAIDAVITWVDGNDPVLKQKREAVLRKGDNKRSTTIAAGFDRIRFKDNGEILFCITSIRKFAPWIRHIHLITDNQVPDFLTPEACRRYDVHIVDHSDIFRSFEWALPTFNTRTIETALFRTPGLAPRYIYFNDDIFLNKPVQPSDFFIGDKVVLRGRWKKLRQYGAARIYMRQRLNRILKKVFGISHTMHLLQQMRSARLAGMTDTYYRAPHVPHPLRVRTQSKFFDQNPGAFVNNIKFPFRDISQFSAVFLSNHLEIINGNAVLEDESDILMINGETDKALLIDKKLKRLDLEEPRFICLQTLEKLQPGSKTMVLEAMRKRLDLNPGQEKLPLDPRADTGS